MFYQWRVSKEPVGKNVTDVCDYVQRVQDFLVIVCAKDCRNMGHGPAQNKNYSSPQKTLRSLSSTKDSKRQYGVPFDFQKSTIGVSRSSEEPYPTPLKVFPAE